MNPTHITAPKAPGKIPPSWPVLIILVAGWTLVGLGGYILWAVL